MCDQEKKVSLLSTKLVERYCRNDDVEGRAYIENEVRCLLRKGGLTKDALQRLERKVESYMKKKTVEAEKEAKEIVLPSERAIKVSAAVEKELENSSIPIDNYLVFQTASEYGFQKEQQERARMKYKKQQAMKEELDRQIESCKNKNDAEKARNEAYAAHVKKARSEWEREQAQARVDEVKKNQRLKEERDAQLADICRRREREANRTMKEEKAIIENAKKELRKEELRAREKMLEQKRYMDKVIQENVINQKLKAEQRERERQEALALQEAYTKKLEQQELDRLETFSRMKAKSAQNQAMYMEATAEKTRYEKDVEERARKYQEAKIAEDQRKAEEQHRKREEDKIRMNEELAEQIRLQKEREKQLEKETAAFAKIYKAEALAAMEQQRAEEAMRRRKALEHKRELQRQIEEKRTAKVDTDSTTMTEEEKRLNMANLRQVTQDPEVVKAITIRLEKCKYAEEAKKRSKLGKRGGPADIEDDEW